MVGTLLDRGANPKLVDEDGKTAYELAKGEGHVACTELLNPKALKATAKTRIPAIDDGGSRGGSEESAKNTAKGNITNVFCAKKRVGHACICPRMVTG